MMKKRRVIFFIRATAGLIIMLAGAVAILASTVDKSVYYLLLGCIALRAGAKGAIRAADNYLPLNVTFEGKDE